MDDGNSAKSVVAVEYTIAAAAVALSQDNRRVAGGYIDGTIHVAEQLAADDGGGPTTWRTVRVLQRNGRAVRCVLFVGGAGDQLLSGWDDCSIVHWDITTGEPLFVFAGHTEALCFFHGSSDVFASVNWDRTMRFWSIREHRELTWTNCQCSGFPLSVARKPGNQRIATGHCFPSVVVIWDYSAADVTNTASERARKTTTLTNHTDAVRSLCFSSDGKFLASGSDDRTISIYGADADEYPLLHRLTGHTDKVNAVVFVDNKYLFSAGNDHTIKLWDAETGECVKTITAHSDKVHALALSADGELLVSGGSVIVHERGESRIQQLFGDIKNAASTS